MYVYGMCGSWNEKRIDERTSAGKLTFWGDEMTVIGFSFQKVIRDLTYWKTYIRNVYMRQVYSISVTCRVLVPSSKAQEACNMSRPVLQIFCNRSIPFSFPPRSYFAFIRTTGVWHIGKKYPVACSNPTTCLMALFSPLKNPISKNI